MSAVLPWWWLLTAQGVWPLLRCVVAEESSSSLLARGSKRRQVTQVAQNPYGTLELPPSSLNQFIATGALPADAVAVARHAEVAYMPEHGDPDKVQHDRIMASLSNYGQQVASLRERAKQQYKHVVDIEQNLTAEFQPAKLRLEEQIMREASEAAKAESKVMFERLGRVHYDQVGALDRSAGFWEQTLAEEKELTKVAQAKTKLEDAAKAMVELQAVVDAKNIDRVRRVEKDRIARWLSNFNAQLAVDDSKHVQGLLEERDRIKYDPSRNIFLNDPSAAAPVVASKGSVRR